MLVWSKTMLGAGAGPSTAGVSTSVRLLVSPVNPWRSQIGELVVPWCTVVCTVTLDPALNVASEPQQSPTRLNSASVHAPDRVSTLSALTADIGPPPVSMLTESFPAATVVPPTFMLIRLLTSCGATATPPGLFFQQ